MCTCGPFCTRDEQPEDLIDPSSYCEACRGLDPYEPCPVLGFGCGPGCDCCTSEQQTAVLPPPCPYSGLGVSLDSDDRVVAARCSCGAQVTVVDGRIPTHRTGEHERPPT